MYRTRGLLLLILLTLLLASCATVRPQAPKVQLVDLQLTQFTFSHATLKTSLELYNPNHFAIDVRRIAFTLDLGGVRIAEGESTIPFTLPAGRSGQADLRLTSPYLNLLQLRRHLGKKKQLPYELRGSIKLGGFAFWGHTLPIHHRGTLSLDDLFGGKH